MSHSNHPTRNGIAGLADKIDDQLLQLHSRAACERRNVWEYSEYKELNELRQLAGALRHGTLDCSRYDPREIELRLVKATRS